MTTETKPKLGVGQDGKQEAGITALVLLTSALESVAGIPLAARPFGEDAPPPLDTNLVPGKPVVLTNLIPRPRTS